MSTTDHLQAAFAGESQANRKYLAFAKKAESDGFPMVAKLFRAAADAETIHAHAHLRAMNGIQATDLNLEAAIAGEAYEFQVMYPEFLADAQAEGNKAAINSFKNALAVEEVHHALYTQALEAVRSGNDLEVAPIYVCPVCGNTVIGDVPDKCEVCGVPGGKFIAIA